MAANTLKTSNNWLVNYFKRMNTKVGHKFSIVTTARKQEIIITECLDISRLLYPLIMKNIKEKNS